MKRCLVVTYLIGGTPTVEYYCHSVSFPQRRKTHTVMEKMTEMDFYLTNQLSVWTISLFTLLLLRHDD